MNSRILTPGFGRGSWWHEHYCRKCRSATGHEEFMTHICFSCGHYGNYNCWDRRAARVILDNGIPRVQYQYSDGSLEIDSRRLPIRARWIGAIVAIVFVAAFLLDISR